VERFVVLTGGPGGGKSALVSAFAALGYATTAEAGRALIRARGGRGEPVAFAEAMFARERESYAWALGQLGTVFFDRGLPDVAAAFAQAGVAVPAEVEAAIAECRYGTAFVAPPWREIYVNDAERDQPWEVAVETYELMAETYARYGYDLVELPRVPVAERLAFVLERVPA
jgi:predicted ATPase